MFAVHIVDWFPTLLRLGGLEEVENLEVEGVGGLEVDGLDLWQSLIKAEPSNRSVLGKRGVKQSRCVLQSEKVHNPLNNHLIVVYVHMLYIYHRQHYCL